MHAEAPVIALKWLTGNDPAHLTALQALLFPYADNIVLAWRVVWLATAVVLIARLAREYRTHRSSRVDAPDEAR